MSMLNVKGWVGMLVQGIALLPQGKKGLSGDLPYWLLFPRCSQKSQNRLWIHFYPNQENPPANPRLLYC